MSRCEQCDTKGIKVELDTVLSLCNDYVKNTITDDKYYLCTNPNCSVTYYSPNGRSIKHQDLITDINFKNDKKKHIVCYCRNIDLDDIVLAVCKLDVITIPKIIHLLQKDDIKVDCLHNHPLGTSCEKEFLEAIEYGKKIKNMKG